MKTQRQKHWEAIPDELVIPLSFLSSALLNDSSCGYQNWVAVPILPHSLYKSYGRPFWQLLNSRKYHFSQPYAKEGLYQVGISIRVVTDAPFSSCAMYSDNLERTAAEE